MARVWTYITISVGLALLLKIAGIPSGLDYILTTMGLANDAYNISLGAFAVAVGVALGISTGASIIIGVFGRSAPEYSLKAPFALANLFIFLSTFTGITNYTRGFEGWVYYPIFLIFTVLGIGFVFALYEWVFGGD